MIETTPDGITTPSGDDEYALAQDLAAMAATIQAALVRRGNARAGTASERMAQTSSLPDGTLWKDTNSEKILWVLDNGGWTRIFPAEDQRVLRIGSYDKEMGFAFLNLRALDPDGSTRYITLQQASDPDSVEGAQLSIGSSENGGIESTFIMRRNGDLAVRSGGQTRTLPYAQAGGQGSVEIDPGSASGSVEVAFPDGYFTRNPYVQLTLLSSFPENRVLSVEPGSLSTTGFRVKAAGTNGATPSSIAFFWHAVQYREGSF